MYLHIQFHLKTSSDLEIFEIHETTTKETLEEICDMRQPAVFSDLDDYLVNSVVSRLNVDELINKYPHFNVQVRDLNISTSVDVEYASLPFAAASQLMNVLKSNNESNTISKFVSENNGEFLTETGALKNISDRMLRPYLTSTCDYDFAFGSDGCATPLRYTINYRNFYICTKGTIYIKMVPPKYTNQLVPICDYDLFEFRSETNLWNTNNTSIKSLEIALTPGKILFIPPYWWSSFLFGKNASVVSFKYRTYVNMVANISYYGMRLLQSHNIQNKNSTKNTSLADLTFPLSTNSVETKNAELKKVETESENVELTNAETKMEITETEIKDVESENTETELTNVEIEITELKDVESENTETELTNVEIEITELKDVESENTKTETTKNINIDMSALD